eukprot:1155657-Pelagomonas_calceolata.AAC.2
MAPSPPVISHAQCMCVRSPTFQNLSPPTQNSGRRVRSSSEYKLLASVLCSVTTGVRYFPSEPTGSTSLRPRRRNTSSLFSRLQSRGPKFGRNSPSSSSPPYSPGGKGSPCIACVQ